MRSSPPAARSPTARIWLAEPVVPLDADARARPGRRLVVVLLAGKLLLRRDLGILKHPERMAGRHQPAHAVGLLDHRTLACGRLLHGQLGKRVGLQPLVGDQPAAAHRPAEAAGGKPRLGPLQRRPPRTQQLIHRARSS